MSDIFDMFSAEPSTYSGSLWTWRSTQGVTTMGGDPFDNIAAVEAQLREYTGVVDLVFTRETIDSDQFASQTYAENIDVALVFREQTHDVVAHARLPEKFNLRGPPDD